MNIKKDAKNTPQWVKWWVTYISNRPWYRGATATENVKKRLQTFWTTDRNVAMRYARLRKGQLLTARINPSRIARGADPNIAEAFGKYKIYQKLMLASDDGREASDLVANLLKDKGVQVRAISRNQITVLDPSVFTSIKSRLLTPNISPPHNITKSNTKRKRKKKSRVSYFHTTMTRMR